MFVCDRREGAPLAGADVVDALAEINSRGVFPLCIQEARASELPSPLRSATACSPTTFSRSSVRFRVSRARTQRPLRRVGSRFSVSRSESVSWRRRTDSRVGASSRCAYGGPAGGGKSGTTRCANRPCKPPGLERGAGGGIRLDGHTGQRRSADCCGLKSINDATATGSETSSCVASRLSFARARALTTSLRVSAETSSASSSSALTRRRQTISPAGSPPRRPGTSARGVPRLRSRGSPRRAVSRSKWLSTRQMNSWSRQAQSSTLSLGETRRRVAYARSPLRVRNGQQPPKPYSSDFWQNSASLAVKKWRLLSPLRTK